MRSIETHVKISRFLIVCYFVHSVSLASTGSAERICPENILSPLKWTLHDDLCVLSGPDPRSWENALSFCRNISSDLLIFDDSILKNNFSVSDPISMGIFNGTVGNDTWIGLHSVNKKLWWEYDVPVRVMREPLSSMYGWSAGQPDRSYGSCGVIQAIYLPDGTSNYTLKLSLTSCESRKSFVCFRKSIDLTVPPTMLNVSSLCPKDWFGNVDSTFCYQFGSKKDFDDSLSSCRMLGGTLLYPKSELEFYFVKAVIDITTGSLGQDNYWVGLYDNDTTVDGESWRNWTYLQSSKNRDFTTGCVYLRKANANNSFELWTVKCTGSNNTVVQVCQIASKSATHPKPDVTAITYTTNISRQNFSTTPLSLTCNADEDFYHPTKPVVWVKDGIYLDNGPPPYGLTLMLNESILSPQLGVYNSGFLSTLQGTYHCEVWGVATERMKLNQTRLTFEDVGTFRGNMSPSANWSMPLPPIAAETFWLPNQTSGPNNILTGLFEFESNNIQIQFDGIHCTVRNKTCSDVKIAFTLYYLYDIDVLWLEKLPKYISSSTLPPDFEGVAWQWFFNEKIYQYLNNTIKNGNAGNNQVKVTIRRTDGCAMETNNDYGRVLHFQSATFNQMMRSAEVCMIGDIDDSPPNSPGDPGHPPPPPSPSGATATCLGNFLDGGSWNLTYLNPSCMQPRKPYTEALWNYTKTLLSPKTVLNVTRNVKALTEGNLYAFDITSVAIILNNIAMVPSLPQDVAENFLQIVENVLGVDKDSVLREAHTMPGNAPFRITNALEMLASNIQLTNSTNFTFQSNNPSFAFRVESTNSSDNSIGFGTKMSEYHPINKYHAIDEFDTAITLSDEVTNIRDFLQKIFNDGVRTTYILYENTGLFNNLSNVQSFSPNNTVHDSNGMDSHTKMHSDSKDFKLSNDKIRINSKVVSGLINGFPLRGLMNNDSIKIIFKLRQKLGTNERCAFVDHADPSGDSPEWGWSFLGLIDKTPDKEMMTLQCYSSHLTNFASILNIDLPKSPILDIISTVGLVISIIGLAITLLSQIFIRKLRQKISQLTIFNLALSLLVVDIIVLAGIEPNPSYPAACPAVACLLHYFLLVAFSWMLIEAIVRYVIFTRFVAPEPYRFVRKVAIPAWLLPAVVVAISVGLDSRHLTEPKKMCWLSPDVFHFGFLLPLGMIMLVNLTLFFLVIKAICKPLPAEVECNQSRKKILWKQTQASINTFIVVGLTWLFAFFAIDGTEGSQTAMAYLFCIFNCFQGFFIFFLICLANKEFMKMVSQWFSSESKKKPTNEKHKPPENLINRFRKGTLDKGTTSLQQVQQITNGEYGANSLSYDESFRTVSTSDGYSYGIGNNEYPDMIVCPDTIELNEITSSGMTGSIRDVDDKSDVCTVASNDTNSTTDSVDDYERRIARINAVREETEIERAPSIFVENTNDVLRYC